MAPDERMALAALHGALCAMVTREVWENRNDPDWLITLHLFRHNGDATAFALHCAWTREEINEETRKKKASHAVYARFAEGIAQSLSSGAVKYTGTTLIVSVEGGGGRIAFLHPIKDGELGEPVIIGVDGDWPIVEDAIGAPTSEPAN